MKNYFKILIILLILVGGLFFYVKNYQDEFEVIFFDIGQGDSALIKFGNGEKMLVDCGPDKNVLYRLGEHLPFFDRTIDYLLITHFDLDHYGGCIDILKRYKVGNVILNGQDGNNKYFYSWKDLLNEKNINQKIISGFEELNIGSSTLFFLSPDMEFNFTDKNDNSIVFKLDTSAQDFLFAGDMGIDLEEKLIEKYCSSTCEFLKADVLKVGHHGSDTSSSEEFLEFVSPDESVISVGENSFGHPSLRVLRKLERAGSEVFRTDVMGSVVF